MPFRTFSSSTNFINHYSQTNQKLKLVDVLLPLVVSLIRLRFSTTLYLIRFIKISKIEENTRENAVYSPPIELLVVCGPKDISIHPLCIGSVLQFSSNPISQIAIVARAQDVELVEKQIKDINTLGKSQISIISEDDFIPFNVRSRLRDKFKKRFGWILQQIIKVKYASESQSMAVLVIDADTVLLQPLRGIDANGNQHFSYSPEMHKNYMEFLKNIKVPAKQPHFSTVTHYLIIQPAIMRELLVEIGTEDLIRLAEKILEFISDTDGSPVSIDYEMYGQFFRSRYSEKIDYRMLSNLSVRRSPEVFQEVEEILKGEVISSFRSFSFHGYL
jgi:hypothetical protein